MTVKTAFITNQNLSFHPKLKNGHVPGTTKGRQEKAPPQETEVCAGMPSRKYKLCLFCIHIVCGKDVLKSCGP